MLASIRADSPACAERSCGVAPRSRSLTWTSTLSGRPEARASSSATLSSEVISSASTRTRYSGNSSSVSVSRSATLHLSNSASWISSRYRPSASISAITRALASSVVAANRSRWAASAACTSV